MKTSKEVVTLLNSIAHDENTESLLFLLDYSPTNLEIMFSNKGSRLRHQVYDLEGPCTSQIFYKSYQNNWMEDSELTQLGTKFLPFAGGRLAKRLVKSRLPEYVDYIYVSEMGIKNTWRIFNFDERKWLKDSGFQLARKKKYLEDPLTEMAQFGCFDFFKKLQGGDFAMFPEDFNAGMVEHKLAYSYEDAPYVLADVAGDIRNLREIGYYHLAYMLANKVGGDRRVEALALAAPPKIASSSPSTIIVEGKVKPSPIPPPPLNPVDVEARIASLVKDRGLSMEEVARNLGFPSLSSYEAASEVQKQIALVLSDHPTLGIYGFMEDVSTPEFAQERRDLIRGERSKIELEWLVDWVRVMLDPSNKECTIRGSYGLKHDAEINAPRRYIGNGQLIIAMLICGFRMKQYRINATFWIDNKSAKGSHHGGRHDYVASSPYISKRLLLKAAEEGVTLDPSQAGNRVLSDVREHIITFRDKGRGFLAQILATEVREAERAEALRLSKSYDCGEGGIYAIAQDRVEP